MRRGCCPQRGQPGDAVEQVAFARGGCGGPGRMFRAILAGSVPRRLGRLNGLAGLAGNARRQQLLQVVLGVQAQGQQFRRGRCGGLAHAVEKVFHHVGEAGHGVEAEHGPGALQGVQGAKHPGHERAVAGVRLQFEQRLFEVDEQVARFLGEHAPRGAAGVHAPPPPRRVAASR